TEWLMREAHAGPAWPAIVAYTTIATIAIVWLTTLAYGAFRISRRHGRGRLAGRRVLITGSAGGIGRAATAALRREGAAVVGLDLVASDGTLATDVRDAEAVRRAVEEAARRMGGIDTVVNNAGIGVAHDAGATPDGVARAVVDVNLFGAWTVTAAAMPYLVRGRGHVVHVSSGLSIATVPWSAAYAASKRALDAYADVLRLEYRGRVSVTTVLPGYIKTGIHDAAAADGVTLDGAVWEDRVGQAGDAILRACADRPRRVSTSIRTAVGLAVARHFPRVADVFVTLGVRRARRGRPAPRLSRPYEPDDPEERSPSAAGIGAGARPS
ncbi:MAG TPA: SDR family NAD(P)-dependent oxidoreductase, partial [Actinomycetota bacterium]|nr:SDR family NAD(P)-dependent oxidoreductase [Actinomycetota bacterium]